MTYDGTHINIYINGKIDGTPAVKSGNMVTGGSPVYIGYGASGLDHYFSGLIDEVMLFNTALQPDQIEALNEMVESKAIPMFGDNTNAYPIFDCWKKIKREYSLGIDKQKKKRLCIYKIE